MNTLVRFDEDHYGYLVDYAISTDQATDLGKMFEQYWPGKKLLILADTDKFIDLTGQYEIVEVPHD